MQTIVISDAAYRRIMSLRIGSEAVSTVILRELPQGGRTKTALLDDDFEKALNESGELRSHEEVFKGV